MNYYMARSIDHAGYYYETRLVLVIVGLGVAGYAASRWGDVRYLVMFASGVIFQFIMEMILQLLGWRGAGYSLSVFGVRLPAVAGMVYQGLAEGGIISLMSFWFADLCRGGWRLRGGPAYVAVCLLILALGCLVGFLARGATISSPRPVLPSVFCIWAGITIAVSLELVAWRGGRDGVFGLNWFWTGCVIYLVLTYTPMQVLGARYIAVKAPDDTFPAAPLTAQVGFMALSHVYEVAGAKLHYFALPFVLGLLNGKVGGR